MRVQTFQVEGWAWLLHNGVIPCLPESEWPLSSGLEAMVVWAMRRRLNDSRYLIFTLHRKTCKKHSGIKFRVLLSCGVT